MATVFVLLAFVFFAYLFYTQQMKWLIGVTRNAACGVAGLLLFNIFFSSLGLAVGINAITVLTVGILGAPGFLLLYATQALVG
jgi:inhibitor of the pro-sigma K processing machinery